MKRIISIIIAAMTMLPSAVTAQYMMPSTEPTTVYTYGPTITYDELMMRRLDAIVDDTLCEVSQIALVVWDLTTDRPIYSRGARQLLRTASTMKLLTAVTALDRLGTQYRYGTSLFYDGRIEAGGVLHGDLICVGGMDPLFNRNDMTAFAQAVAAKGIKSIRGRIVTDCMMKDPDKWGEGWCWDDKNPILTPLLYDGKEDFTSALLKELQRQRVNTAGARIAAGSVTSRAVHICTRSHSIDEVLTQMMKESDNLFAEATYYQVAAASGRRPATAKEAREAERNLFDRLGIESSRYRLADGSGLSLYNYLTAEAQVALLRYAWLRRDIYDHLLPALPIAGVDGTLKKRMTGTAAEGNVRAKTGTVTGVSALSGYLTAPNGHRMAFCIINQGISRAAIGREFQDRVCAALCTP